MAEAQAAWVAGIIEGEGTFLINESRTRLTVNMTDLDVLQRLQDWTGVGVIYIGVTPAKPHHKQSWRWVVSVRQDFLDLTDTITPWLLSRRAARLAEVRAFALARKSA